MSSKAKVYRADLYGLRESKYSYLWENDVASTQWEEVKPQTPFYLFEKQNAGLLEEYQRGWSVTKTMPVNVLGFQTHRDKFAIDFDKKTLEKRISQLCDSRENIEKLRNFYKLGKWNLKDVREKLQRDKSWKAHLTECFYRPFDKRWSFYSDSVMDRPRTELINHVLHHDNFCINVVRQTKMDDWRHVLASDTPTPAVFIEIKDGSSIFPLYLYPDNESLFAQPSGAPSGRRPNLSEPFVEDLKTKLELDFIADGRGNLSTTFGPEDVFYYLYAVLHSPTYRSRYAEFLKIDFPRIPLTSDRGLFAELCEKGKTLSDLHLMKTRGTRPANFPEDGDNIVDKPRFDKERVYINKTQYFGNVPEQVWNFYVGGYQVLHKWLKDRKGRELSYDDTQHYRYVVAALADTIDLMSEIDVSIDAKGGFPLS